MKYAVIASTFSGNKGAASMLEASIQTITKKDKEAQFSLFTVYPEEDAKFNSFSNVELLNGKPLYLGLVINPLTLLYKVLPPFRWLLKKNKAVRVLSEADVLLDQGGITFVDGRTKFLIYNVATILPGFFTNTRVIKCSQAMGPFSGINKLVAKLVLPRIDIICARGAKTREFLGSLGLNNVIDATDYAFLLDISKEEAKEAEKLLKSKNFTKESSTKLIAVLPSEVVRKKTEKSVQNYVEYNRQFVNKLLKDGHQVLLLAYSAREHKESRHNNDLPVCRSIVAGMKHENLRFIDKEISAQQLRYIIGITDVIVTSRFHAMIAALSMKVPPIVVGWSHKYAEVMDMFDLEELALSSEVLESKKLTELVNSTLKNRKKIINKISKALPEVRKSSNRQVDAICKS